MAMIKSSQRSTLRIVERGAMKRAISGFIMLSCIIVVFTHCSKDAMVTAKKGITLQEKPDLQSQKNITVPYRAIVEIVDDDGPVIDAKKERGVWYKIKFGTNHGWVINNVLERKIPYGFEKEVAFISGANSTAFIYLLLYKNKTFSLYFVDHIAKRRNIYTFKGRWIKEEGDYRITFDRDDNNCKNCEPGAMFIGPDGTSWDRGVKIINMYSFSFNEDSTGLQIWGISCQRD